MQLQMLLQQRKQQQLLAATSAAVPGRKNASNAGALCYTNCDRLDIQKTPNTAVMRNCGLCQAPTALLADGDVTTGHVPKTALLAVGDAIGQVPPFEH